MFFRITRPGHRDGVRGALAVLTAASIGLSCGDDGPTDSGGNGGSDPDPSAYDVPADGTLGEVLEVATAGDTIRVAAGTHEVDDPLLIAPSQAGLRILGRETARGDTRPVLMCATGGAALRVQSGADEVVIAGLEMRGTFGTGIEIAAENVTVEDMWIEGATSYAIVCEAPANGPVRGNVLVDAGVFGVRCLTGSMPLITQNTIVGAGDCGVYIQSASPVVERNAIYDSVTYAIACFGGIPQLACNVLFLSGDSNYSSLCPQGAGDVEADPLFCSDGSYRVGARSPCRPSKSCDWVGAVQDTCPPPPTRAVR